VTSSYARGFLHLLGASVCWGLGRRVAIGLRTARAAIGRLGLDVQRQHLQAVVALVVRGDVGEHAVVAGDVAVRARGGGVVDHDLARRVFLGGEAVDVHLVVPPPVPVRGLPGADLDHDLAADLAIDHLQAVAQVDVHAAHVGVQESGRAVHLLAELDTGGVDHGVDVDDRVGAAHGLSVAALVLTVTGQATDQCFHEVVRAEHSDSC
jgi:hypothetical protein